MAGKYLGKGRMQTGSIESSVDTGRWKKWSIGIDVHKMMCMCAVIVPDYENRQLHKQISKFDTDYKGLEEMKNWLLAFREEHGPAEFVIESTATYHRPVVYTLRDCFDLILVNPVLAGEGKKKADKYDAGLLAYHGLTGLFAKAYPFPEAQHESRTVSRRYAKARGRYVSATNSIGTTLLDYGILLNREIKVYSASGQVIVDAIARGVKDPVEAASCASYYFGSGRAEKEEKRSALTDALKYLPFLPDSVRRIIGKLKEDADYFAKRMVEYQEILQSVFETWVRSWEDRTCTANECIDLLCTRPGTGVQYAQVYIAEMGLEVERHFANAPQSVAYAGLDPSKRYSADKVTSAKSRPANAFIHSAAVQCAQSMLQKSKHDNPIAAWGRAYKSRNGGDSKAHNSAVAGMAKRLLTVSYHILRTGQPCNYSNYEFSSHKINAMRKMRGIRNQLEDLKTALKNEQNDDTLKAAATEIICSVSDIIGSKGEFVLNPDVPDELIENLPFKPRVKKVFLKAGISSISSLWFRLVQGKLMDIDKFGEASYKDTVEILINKGFITRRGGKNGSS